MVTIRSYTTIEQSRKLAEILPLESADMYYTGHQSIITPKEWEYGDTPNIRGKYISFDDKRIFYPCWSLAALLGVLPKEINIEEQCYAPCLFPVQDKWLLKLWYNSNYTITSPIAIFSDNPVDACYEVILKLHELKML